MATLTFTELEQVWVNNGGAPSTAILAAAVASAESSGHTDAISPSGDFGLWQINGAAHPTWDSSRLLDADYNAQAAIAISSNGTDWRAWCTAYTDGACGRDGGVFDPTGDSPAGHYYQLNAGGYVPPKRSKVRTQPRPRTVIVGDSAGQGDQSHLPKAWQHLVHAFDVTVNRSTKAANRASKQYRRTVTIRKARG